MNLLSDIKIIDFSRLLPGPFGTHLLAQMGAKVIKIESPKRLDYTRFIGKTIDGASALYHQLNHNKKQLLIDYNNPEGLEQIYDLVKTADVLIEQFRPKAMEAWGLGFKQLKSINPNLIYISVTAYAHDGPNANEAGHDLNFLSYSGAMSLITDDNGKPNVPDIQIADISAGYTLAMAVQAAIIKQFKSRKSIHINVPIANTAMPFISIPFALDEAKNNPLNGKTQVNYAVYQCADDKWISLAAYELKFWNLFCQLVNKPEWKSETEQDLSVDVFDKNELIKFFKSQKQNEWIEFFKGHDVCISPILTLNELVNSDFHQQNKTLQNFATPNGTPLQTMALPFFIIEE